MHLYDIFHFQLLYYFYFSCYRFANQNRAVFGEEFNQFFGFRLFGVYMGTFGFDVTDDGLLFLDWWKNRLSLLPQYRLLVIGHFDLPFNPYFVIEFLVQDKKHISLKNQ